MRTIFVHQATAESERSRLISLIEEFRKADPAKNIYVVVPDYDTLEYEQDILKSKAGMMNVAVKSIKHIQNLVLDVYGYGTPFRNKPPVIRSNSGDVAKTYVILNDNKEELLFIKSPRITSAERISETITDLKSRGYTSEKFKQLMNSPDIPTALWNKLHDIDLLMNCMESENGTAGKLQEVDAYNIFLSRLSQSMILSESYVIFCGFDYITTYQASLSLAVLNDNNVHFIMKIPNASVYSRTLESICMLRDHADNVNIKVLPLYTDVLDEISPQIRYIGNTLIGLAMEKPKDFSNISVYNASNQYYECLHAIQQLIRWHNEGCSWKDMGVVMKKDSIIMNIFPLLMESAGVPYFMSFGRSSMLCSSIYYLSKVISSVNGYTTQDIIDVIKSGYTTLSEKESLTLETYVHERGIKGDKWKKPFRNKYNDPKVDALNVIREKLMTPILNLHAKLANRAHKAKDQAKDIWEFIEETGFYARIREKEAEALDRNYIHYADQLRQSWHVICKTLNVIATDTTNDHLSIKNLSEIVTKCFHSEMLKSIPQTADAVLVDEARAFVPGMRKNCILLSLQEMIVEQKITILTDAEKKWLDNSGVDAFPFGNENTEVHVCQKFVQDQYKAVMSATEKLYLSSSALSYDGKPLTPDSLFKDVTSLLRSTNPGNIKGGVIENGILPYCRDIAVEMISQKLRELVYFNDGDLSENADSPYADQWKKVYDYLLEKEPETIHEILASMNAAPFAEDIPSGTAQSLFNGEFTSISELEKQARCPYAHFITYGIRPKEVRDYRFENDEKGKFYHEAMRLYMERAEKDKDFPNISQEKIVRYFNESVQPLIDNLMDGPLAESTLSRMEMNEYIHTVRVTAIFVTFWLAKTDFRPKGYEIDFSNRNPEYPPMTLTMKDGKKVTLTGKIDRMDTYTDPNGVVYGRVVDYKSSAHTLDREDVMNGFELQLPIYLKTILDANPNMKPAGAVYQHITNAIVDTDSEDEDVIREKVLNNTKLVGMYNEDINTETGVETKGSTKTLKALSENELTQVLDTSKGKATEFAQEINDGVIRIDPKKVNDKLPCEYCKAKNICMIANSGLQRGE